MINHARTLLINRRGGKQNLRDLGEEYIPESFTGQVLPPWLKAYQQVLFGANPENTYLNFQADRLLRLVHATEYEPYVTVLDNRLTYDPNVSPFSKTQYGYGLTSSDGVITEVIPVGNVMADESRGVMRFRWSFTIVNQVATITNMLTGKTSEILLVNPAADGHAVSDIFVLPGTNFSVRLRKKSPYTIASWTDNIDLTLLTRPMKSLTDKLTELEALREFERNLFGVEVGEPYNTLFGLWRTSGTLPDRITGILMAMVFRMHENYLTRNS